MRLKLKLSVLLKFLDIAESVDDIDVDEKFQIIPKITTSATNLNCNSFSVNTLAEAWPKPVSANKSTKKVEPGVHLANSILLTGLIATRFQTTKYHNRWIESKTRPT